MALAALTAAAALGAVVALLWSRPLAWAVAALAVCAVIAFELTTLPFLAKVWRRDRGVLLPAVGLLWVRAYALGAGFATGLVRFRGQAGDRRPALTAVQRLPKRSIDLLGRRRHACRDRPPDGGHRARDQARLARPGHLPPGAHRPGWPSLPHPQVPHDGGRRGGAAAATGRPRPAQRAGVQAASRSAHHARGSLPAPLEPGRAAAARSTCCTAR